MSGGHFSEYNETTLCHAIFGWDVDPTYGIGDEKYYRNINHDGWCEYSRSCKEYYEQDKKSAVKANPFDDRLVSELVYDVLCLIHSKDYAISGDIQDCQYEDDLKAFRDKWFKGIQKDHMKKIIDCQIEDLRKELYGTFNLQKEND